MATQGEGIQTLTVAVVEDEFEEREKIRKCLAEVEEQLGTRFYVDEYTTAEAFLMYFESQYDLIFMDIHFEKGMDGMEAARQLRQIDTAVLLVFVTNLVQLAVKGYEVDAVDFMVKPLETFSFVLKMKRILGRAVHRKEQYISVKIQGETLNLPCCQIQYVESEGHYVKYHCRDGVFAEYIAFKEAEKKIRDPVFFRCNRGILVNLRLITRINQETCVIGGEEIPVAKVFRASLKKAYAGYLSGLMR